jgi:predicted nucleic acid-binding protein
MRVYLDNCTFNRPFDSQASIRIRIEAEAKLYIQEKIRLLELELIWSYILDFENDQNPFGERKSTIKRWKQYCAIDVEETDEILKNATSIMNKGIKAKDALHIASAMEGNAGFFITTDDGILKKASGLKNIKVINPTEFIKLIEIL